MDFTKEQQDHINSLMSAEKNKHKEKINSLMEDIAKQKDVVNKYNDLVNKQKEVEMKSTFVSAGLKEENFELAKTFIQANEGIDVNGFKEKFPQMFEEDKKDFNFNDGGNLNDKKGNDGKPKKMPKYVTIT